jgi:dipeptidase D
MAVNLIDVTSLVAEEEANFLADYQDLIAIPSFEDEKTTDSENPFGVGISAGLHFFEKLAQRDGFNYGNIENRVVWISYGDDSADANHTVAVMGHVDVVPGGEGWDTNPFEAVLKDDGEIYGRGAMDMKGDLLANYYALRYLKRHDLMPAPGTKIHLIIGGNEEGYWDDLPHYFAEQGLPTVGYSPDGKFPVGQGEKGLLSFEIKTPQIEQFGSTRLLSFEGGEAENLVPGSATASIQTPYAAAIKSDFLNYLARRPEVSGDAVWMNGELRLTLVGRSAHGAYPYLGINAITTLAHFLTRIDFDPFIKAFLEVVGKFLHNDPYAKKLGIAYTDDVMGPLTENLGVLSFDETGWSSLINFRLPKGIDPDRIITQFNQLFTRIGVQAETVTRSSPAHFVPSNDPIVAKLSEIYTAYTGDTDTTFVANGGSYASLLSRGVAFGGQFPEVEVVSHQANEHATFKNYFKGMAIFASAMLALSDTV